MRLQPDQISLLISVIIALNVVAIVAFIVMSRLKLRRERRRLAAITAALIDYFHKTGVDVSAGCTKLMGSHTYSAVIESEPMKRFRLSHIIEIALRDHVKKACGLDLGNVYWRFPIKDTPAVPGNTDIRKDEKADEYINEGLEQYKYIPKVEVTEMSWEHFTEASTSAPGQEVQAGVAHEAQTAAANGAAPHARQAEG
ncbi:hypothetical protein BH11PSE11_BH11PSE11_14410 [soil metagenome]